jgi:cell pole-organizing protein PopZ
MADGRNEPSIDEILASIKRIIVDDDRNRPATKPAAKLAGADGAQDEVLELADTDSSAGVGDVLLDTDKTQSLRHSFSALQTLSEPGAAPQIVRSGETSLEELTRGLLRPMLKDWFDSHLPPIVEAMVEREITRITKKR